MYLLSYVVISNQGGFIVDRNKNILRKWIIIITIPTAIFSGLIPLIRMFFPKKIVGIIFKVDIVLICITFALLILSLVISKNIFFKLTAIPITYVIVIITLMMKKSGVYLFFLNNILGKPIPEINTTEITNYNILLHSGVFISIIPLIVYAIYFTVKMNKVKKDIVKVGIPQIGYITELIPTNTRINKIRVYTVWVKVGSQDYSQYDVKRDVAIPNHMIHLFSIGNSVNILIDPNNNKNVFFNLNHTIL